MTVDSSQSTEKKRRCPEQINTSALDQNVLSVLLRTLIQLYFKLKFRILIIINIYLQPNLISFLMSRKKGKDSLEIREILNDLVLGNSTKSKIIARINLPANLFILLILLLMLNQTLPLPILQQFLKTGVLILRLHQLLQMFLYLMPVAILL